MDFATNWIRAFRLINREIKWLNAFGVINELAAKKVLHKFMKNCFVKKDNVLDKSFAKIIERSEFARRRNMERIQHDIIQVMANYFTDKDYEKGL